jgi:hypothetical protein|tara:strand:- start:513 stop:770 length:258 start_codon:yes stop_codon:yes gene_type:complete
MRRSKMRILKYLLVLTFVSSVSYSNCFVCGVVPQEWNLNLHMASNEYADEIKKKKKKKGKKIKGKAGKKGGWGKWKSKWKKKKAG